MGAVQDSAWYLVRSKPTAGATAAANLRGRAVEVFLPRLSRPVAGLMARDTEPLFPGYLFARLSLGTQFRIAAWTPGVAHLLPGLDGAPAASDESVVAALRQRARDGEVLQAYPALRAGDSVEIRTGPFAGLLAVIARPRSGASRIQILREVLRRQIRVELPASAVVPA